MATHVELVPFENHQITTVRQDTDVFVVMKPIVAALGLDWNGQYQRINRHPAIRQGMFVTHIPSAGGEQEAVTLQLEQFHGWLVTLHPERVRDPLKRELIVSYQRRAFRVLFDHFHGAAQLPAAMPIQSHRHPEPGAAADREAAAHPQPHRTPRHPCDGQRPVP